MTIVRLPLNFSFSPPCLFTIACVNQLAPRSLIAFPPNSETVGVFFFMSAKKRAEVVDRRGKKTWFLLTLLLISFPTERKSPNEPSLCPPQRRLLETKFCVYILVGDQTKTRGAFFCLSLAQRNAHGIRDGCFFFSANSFGSFLTLLTVVALKSRFCSLSLFPPHFPVYMITRCAFFHRLTLIIN